MRLVVQINRNGKFAISLAELLCKGQQWPSVSSTSARQYAFKIPAHQPLRPLISCSAFFHLFPFRPTNNIYKRILIFYTLLHCFPPSSYYSISFYFLQLLLFSSRMHVCSVDYSPLCSRNFPWSA